MPLARNEAITAPDEVPTKMSKSLTLLVRLMAFIALRTPR
jgi:hypothetical protein